MGPCWPGGWFLPAAHISGQIFVRNKKFSIVVVHHESYRKNIPISFKVLIVWLTSAFFEQKLKLYTIFKEPELLIETRFFRKKQLLCSWTPFFKQNQMPRRYAVPKCIKNILFNFDTSFWILTPSIKILISVLSCCDDNWWKLHVDNISLSGVISNSKLLSFVWKLLTIWD